MFTVRQKSLAASSTAAKLHSHCFDPLRSATLDKVGNAISIWHPLHLAEAKPPQYVSPVRETVPSWHVLQCMETVLMKGPSLSRFIMRLPCRSVSGVSFSCQRTGGISFLNFPLET